MFIQYTLDAEKYITDLPLYFPCEVHFVDLMGIFTCTIDTFFKNIAQYNPCGIRIKMCHELQCIFSIEINGMQFMAAFYMYYGNGIHTYFTPKYAL